MSATQKSILALSAALLLSACGGAVETPSETVVKDAPEPRIVTRDESGNYLTRRYSVKNSAGSNIGSVTIADTETGVSVNLDVTAIPAGTHAIHFHENGTCDGPDFKTAGGHYNPKSVNHGFEADAPRPHAGDMRNFESPASGVVKTTIENGRVSLSPRSGLAPLFDLNGTALIIHAGADDYESQPSGAAGARIACAVVRIQ